MKNKNTIILIVGVVALIVFWFIGKYNGLVNKEENVNSKWAQVENVYQRRADLIPNLVATVKGYAEHEQQVLTDVIAARAKATSVNFNADNMTEENIKALSAIAVGTNNTLASVSQVVTSAALGQVKALKQLGIVAKATGDQIEVSYKGQKSVIDNTSESIMKYINDISKNNCHFGSDSNEVLIVDDDVVSVPLASKKEIAKTICDVISKKL